MPANTLSFQSGKVYCIHKRLLSYEGPGRPWLDICTGDLLPLDPACIDALVEVPETVVEAVKLVNSKRTLPGELPVNSLEEGDEDFAPESWERDIYWDG